MSRSKLQKLKALSENELRQDVIIPLLLNMKYRNVQDTHGADEFGKDIVCQYDTGLQTLNTAIVVKKGDVSGSTSPKSTGGTLGVIREQIHLALSVQSEDLNAKAPLTITNVIVWISGKFKSKARHQITYDRSNAYVNIEFRDGAKTVELLDAHYPEYWTIGDHTIVNYFSNAREKHSKLEDILALGSAPARHHLPKIFVPPRLALIPKVRSKQSTQKQRPMKEVPFTDLLESSNDRIAIIGDLGTGKSTALRRILLLTIESNLRDSHKYPVPIYIRFRDIDFSTNDPIIKALQSEFASLAPSEQESDIDEILEDGHLLVLIDGLDELESKERIERALEELNLFSQVYSRSRIVITSRSIEILETTSMLARFTMYRILYLNFTQVKTMIRRWFADNVDDGEKLIREILNPVTFTSIPLTPFTMAMLAAVYRGNTHDLPANLTELFNKYVGQALGQWDSNKGIESQIEWKLKKSMLCELAWHLLQSDELGITFEAFETLVDAKLTEVGLPYEGGDLVDQIIERSGLLVPTVNNEYAFKHHAFFSYFSGHSLIVQPEHKRLIAEHFYDMTWSKTIFFAFGTKYNDSSYLTYVVENVPIPTVNLLYYAVQLGMITQASYYVSNDIKTEAIGRSLVSFVLAWDELVSTLQELGSSDPKSRHVSQFTLLNFVCANVIAGLGAPILQVPLQTVAEEIPDTMQVHERIETIDDIAQGEWFAFFLAIASVGAMALDSFEQLLSRNIIRNPLLLACCEIQAQLMFELLELEGAERVRLQAQLTKLGRRLKGRREEIGKLFDQAPNPIAQLPSASIEDIRN